MSMSLGPTQAMLVEQRLDRIERTLNRMCAELDILARGVAKLLEANQSQREGEQLLEDFEALRDERDTEASERPTMPPPEERGSVP